MGAVRGWVKHECSNDWGGRRYDDSIPGEVNKTIFDYMIPYMVDKVTLHSTHFTRGLVK